MEVKPYKLIDIFENYDYLRKPLSSMERESFQGDYPYYGAQGVIDHVQDYICDGEYMLIAEDGENLMSRNQPIAVIVDGKFWVNNHAHIVKTNNLASMKYICYLLNSSDITGFITGSAQPKLSQANLNKIKMLLPSIEYQEQVASILSAYDNFIEVNNKRIKVLEQMAENLYKEWFVRFRFPGHESVPFENGLPKGWTIKSVKETFDIFDSLRVPLSSLERDNMIKIYPYYGAAELLDYVEDYLFDGIYLLLGEDGSVITPEGKPMLQYVWGKFWVNNHAHILQGKEPFSTEYIHLMFKCMDVTGVVTGSAQPKISQARLFKKNAIIPENRIIERFNSTISPMYEELRMLKNQNKNLVKQRDLLLPRLMSGKLEV